MSRNNASELARIILGVVLESTVTTSAGLVIPADALAGTRNGVPLIKRIEERINEFADLKIAGVES